MGKICLITSFVLISAGCSTGGGTKPAGKDEVEDEVKLKSDRDAIVELRKDIPAEIRKSNDRLAEVLKRWKTIKMPPEELREKFSDEIRKMRNELDKKQKRAREDFQRKLSDKRKQFQDDQKDQRSDFLSAKRTQDKRDAFFQKQSTDRDRFQADQRDERDQFEESLKDDRKAFEDDIALRWVEFRQEYPEYQRLYKEMKLDEEAKKEEARKNPKPYTGWPYKDEDDKSPGNPKKPAPENVDVNKGGEGWPSSDMSEFDQIPKTQGP